MFRFNRKSKINKQVRQWLKMWKAHLGKEANLPNFIAALERRGDSADCVERLRKICAKRFEFAIVALILNIIYRVATK